jgi:NitT/TauT family transport system permease protein
MMLDLTRARVTEDGRDVESRIFNREAKVRLTQVMIILAFLTVIEAAPRLGYVDRFTLIPFTEMVLELATMFSGDIIYEQIATTFTVVGAAYLLAIAIGLPIGLLMGRSILLFDIFRPYLLIFYAIPIFAFYPLFIQLLGFNILPILVIAWLFSLMIIITNTATGLNEVSNVYLKVGRDYGLSSWEMFYHVELPAATPYIFSGMKLGLIYAILATIGSEFLLATSGLGWLISHSYHSFEVRTMYAAILLIPLITSPILYGLNQIESKINRRR